jgi:hypothetical protein
MSNNNPNTMSNDDLEKDAAGKDVGATSDGNQQNVNKSTAAEGDLLDPEQDPNQVKDGSLPHSEELSLEEEEDGYDDPDKLSS